MIYREEDHKVRMSVSEVIKYIKNRKKKNKFIKVRMTTNPYNNYVIRLDYMDTSVRPPEFETVWLEMLTDKTIERLTAIADENLHGRYW